MPNDFEPSVIQQEAMVGYLIDSWCGTARVKQTEIAASENRRRPVTT